MEDNAPEIVGKMANGRPILRFSNGDFATERTITVEMDGKSVNVPTIFGGKEVSPEEAVAIVKKNKLVDPDTGEELPTFDNPEVAERAARKRSNDLGQSPEFLKALGDIKKKQLNQLYDKSPGMNFDA